jgi:hypothetical protein
LEKKYTWREKYTRLILDNWHDKIEEFQKIRKHKQILKNMSTQVVQHNITYILDIFLKKLYTLSLATTLPTASLHHHFLFTMRVSLADIGLLVVVFVNIFSI